jgi:hypothetical protein
MDPLTYFALLVNAYAANLLKNSHPTNLYAILKRARLVSHQEIELAKGPTAAAWDYVSFHAGFDKRPEWLFWTEDEVRSRDAFRR